MSKQTTRRMVCFVLSMALVSIMITAFSAKPAAADAKLSNSVPAENAEVSSPKQVELHFGSAVEAGLSQIGVKDPSGKSVDSGKVFVVQGGANMLGVKVTGTTPGKHTVAWRVTAADGHAMTGTFAYNVKATAAAANAEVASTTTIAPSGSVIVAPENASSSEKRDSARAVIPAFVLSISLGISIAIFLRRRASSQ